MTLQFAPESVRFAWLNLKRNSRRSLLSISIIAIAVFALTSAGGFGLYTYHSLKEMAARDSGHLTISLPNYFEKEEEMPLSNGLSHTQTQMLTNTITKEASVRGVQPRIYFTGLVSNGNKSTIFVGLGVDQHEFDMKGPFLDVQSGQTLMDVSSRRYHVNEPQVMLTKGLASNLSVQVGDWVTVLSTTSEGALNAMDFKVNGIYSTGVPELDKRQLYLHVSLAQQLLVSEKVSTLSVFLYDTNQTGQLESKLMNSLTDLSPEQRLQITPWQERAFFYKKVRNLYDRIFGILGAIMALVVFVALFNTLTMSVTERTREIGTLSALGSYPAEIINNFIKEATLLALMGSMLGALLTAFTCLLLMFVDIQMPPPPGSTEGYPLMIYFSYELVGYASFGVLMICVIAAYFSAKRGVNKPITEALIYV